MAIRPRHSNFPKQNPSEEGMNHCRKVLQRMGIFVLANFSNFLTLNFLLTDKVQWWSQLPYSPPFHLMKLHISIRLGYGERVTEIFLYTSCFPYCFIRTAQWISVICDSCQEGPRSWNAALNAIHSTRIISSHSQEGYTDLGSVQTWELTQQVIYSPESPRKTCVLWHVLRRSLIQFQRSIIGHQCLGTTVKRHFK